MRIEQPVKGFGAFGEFSEVALLQRFGECVEQAPDVALLKGIVPGFAPFMKHRGDQTVGTDTNIGSPDDKVMGFDVGDVSLFVSCDAFVLIMPFGQEKADGSTDQLGQVADDETCVLACEFDLATEAQIVTNENTGTRDNASRKGLVVAVSETEHPAIIITGGLGMDLHQSKIALTFVGQRMGLIADPQVGGG